MALDGRKVANNCDLCPENCDIWAFFIALPGFWPASWVNFKDKIRQKSMAKCFQSGQGMEPRRPQKRKKLFFNEGVRRCQRNLTLGVNMLFFYAISRKYFPVIFVRHAFPASFPFNFFLFCQKNGEI